MSRPEIMLLGTFHMAMDPHQVDQQQEQIKKVVGSFHNYKPTKIAVEKSFLIEEELARKYQEYREGNLTPAYDEVEQFAFRLAASLNHPQVYPVDEIVDMSNPTLEQVFEWAKEHQPSLFQEVLEVQTNLKKMEDDSTIIDTLTYVNNPEYIKELQRIYMKLSRVGDRQHQIGVQWLKQWHQRDLSIAANIARVVEKNDRILVLIGGDHLHLLEQFLKESGDFIIKPALPFLNE